jgi:sensor histidine kinase regulating citrate/malate metabolism
MHFFRVRLILALVACVTLVSVASTYFDLLAHRHIMREDLERRTQWMGRSIQNEAQSALASGDPSKLPAITEQLKSATGALGLVLFDDHGKLLTSTGPQDVIAALSRGAVNKSLQKGIEVDAFGHV